MIVNKHKKYLDNWILRPATISCLVTVPIKLSLKE